MVNERLQTISVCLATYNGEKYILEQCSSVLKQLSSQDELIISDDHSSDSTLKLVSSLNDDRIKIVLNPSKRGYSTNFENALAYAKGDYIFLCDQDDVWVDHKVDLMVEQLASYDFVVSDAIVTDENLNVVIPSHFEYNHVRSGFMHNFFFTRYTGACMAFRRELLNTILPFPPQHQLCPHDYWIAIMAEAYYKVKLIKTPLIYYRRHHSNSSSGGVEKSPFNLSNKLERRFYCGLHVLLRMKKVCKSKKKISMI